MSLRAISWAWKHGPKNQGELLVLLALADFANDDGECWPAMSTIAEKARVTERATRRIIRRLEVSGFLRVETGGGRRGSNRYRMLMGETRTNGPPGDRKSVV